MNDPYFEHSCRVARVTLDDSMRDFIVVSYNANENMWHASIQTRLLFPNNTIFIKLMNIVDSNTNWAAHVDNWAKSDGKYNVNYTDTALEQVILIGNQAASRINAPLAFLSAKLVCAECIHSRDYFALDATLELNATMPYAPYDPATGAVPEWLSSIALRIRTWALNEAFAHADIDASNPQDILQVPHPIGYLTLSDAEYYIRLTCHWRHRTRVIAEACFDGRNVPCVYAVRCILPASVDGYRHLMHGRNSTITFMGANVSLSHIAPIDISNSWPSDKVPAAAKVEAYCGEHIFYFDTRSMHKARDVMNDALSMPSSESIGARVTVMLRGLIDTLAQYA